MAKHSRFMIFRSYTPAERADPNERMVFYGWSQSKSVVSAFLKQRSKKKYKVQKMPVDMIEKIYGESLTPDSMIDYAYMFSAATRERVTIFMTALELTEAKKKIQRMFRELSSLDQAGEDIMEVLELFMNLDPYYGAALEYLGFRPRALDDLFPSADEHDDYASITGIEEAIDGGYDSAAGTAHSQKKQPEWVVEDVSKHIIYSLESFIKVLRDDM